MKKILILLSLVSTLTLANNYDVVFRKDSIKLDGNLNDKVWNTVAEVSGGFHYPWEDKEVPMTKFKAYHDNENLYYSFKVYDKEVLVEKGFKEDESTVDVEDRVELFFAPDKVNEPVDYKLLPYYATEIDAYGRVHDYKIDYYRKFDYKFNFEGSKNVGKVDKDGYKVEGFIPLNTLKELNLIDSKNIMRAGIFRAEFSKLKDEIQMQWISWVNPKTKVPDFHVDSAFGEFRFLDIK